MLRLGKGNSWQEPKAYSFQHRLCSPVQTNGWQSAGRHGHDCPERYAMRLTCCRKCSIAMARRRSSTPIKAANLPSPNSSTSEDRSCRIGRMAVKPGGAMFWLNDYGKMGNMNGCNTCLHRGQRGSRRDHAVFELVQ